MEGIQILLQQNISTQIKDTKKKITNQKMVFDTSQTAVKTQQQTKINEVQNKITAKTQQEESRKQNALNKINEELSTSTA